MRRVRSLIGNPELAFILPFCITADEVQLAVGLELPIYGCDQALNWLGTKKGRRRVFEEEGVPHPVGLQVDGRNELEGALDELRRRSLAARGAVMKLDRGLSGLGNALVDLTPEDRDVAGTIELEDEELSAADYLAALDDEGGIVEERIGGDAFRSPSVQLRMSPSGKVDIMSTHDQVLGGPHGQTYVGCHFPADQGYAAQIAAEVLKVGRRLAREGVIGRASVNFAAVRRVHMVSALAVAGRIGLTAIGDTLEQARGLYYEVKAAVDEAAGSAPAPG
jgi:hypothetical protein